MKGTAKTEAETSAISAELHDHFGRAMRLVGGSFEVRECAVLGLANELARTWIQDELERMAQGFGQEVVVDGQRYRRHELGVGRYHTLCGKVEVRRASFRLVGIHNGPTIVPLEIRAGLVEHATPALAFSAVQGFAERPLRHYEAEMQAAHRVVPSRSTLERIGKRTGQAIRAIVEDVEPLIRGKERLPAGAHSISVGVDRTTVPMAEVIEDRPAGARRRPYVREAPPPVTVAYRMAYVGTVAVHDDEGHALVTKRFAATPSEGPAELMARIGAEVLHLLEQRPGLFVTIVQDGAPELWNLIEGWASRHQIGINAELIDRFHVDERIAETCELLTCTPEHARELREAWRSYLDRSDTAIVRICRRVDELLDYTAMYAHDGAPAPAFWRSRAPKRLPGTASSIVGGHIEYFRRYRDRIRYATPRRLGLPIGSGVTEGACKSVVTMRFKRSGQRWCESGLAPCLSLRALHLSDRLRPCFARLQAAQAATLEAA